MGMAAEPQLHVLAVDDSFVDRKLIERLLKKSSYQVTTVDSGRKALEFLGWQEETLDSQQVSSSTHKKEIEVNLIITDYCMPGMTGYDLLKKVKESPSLRNIPVVIMSSENDPSRITRCLDEGAEEFFIKPVQLADVNKLRPHMLGAKYGKHQQDLDTISEDSQKPERGPCREPDQQPQKEQVLEPQTEKQQPPPPPPSLPLPLVHRQQNNSKRKSMEDGLSADRTRPRFSGLTTVV